MYILTEVKVRSSARKLLSRQHTITIAQSVSGLQE
jgi:hypothetical protein